MSKPFVKWAGGKEKELYIITPNLPTEIKDYYEPFVGGGAVFFSFNEVNITGKRFINDKSDELILLYKYISNNDKEFFLYLEQLEHNWVLLSDIVYNNKQKLLSFYDSWKNKSVNKIELKDQITEFIMSKKDDFNGMLCSKFNVQIEEFYSEIVKALMRKIERTAKLEGEGDFGKDNILENIETAFKSAFYTHFRRLYNQRGRCVELKEIITAPRASAIFYFIREFCYASMFRYNKNGEFNVPYGGMAYNKKDFSAKIEQIKNEKYQEYIKNTSIYNYDFETFVKKVKPGEGDFIFLDPPYDTEFSEYAKNSFDKDDQARLANYLYNTKANFMLVIKSTPYILSLYENKGFNIYSFDKKYMVNFQNRNDRDVKHLMITNYVRREK
ncbi:MAG: DNA adenine methylase [Anaeroplasma sp.]